jgi:hypothetical protein
MGYYFIYSVQRDAIQSNRYELTQKATQIHDIVLEDNIQSIIWEEEREEFYKDGVLYDVRSFDFVKGKLVMHCVADDKETELTRSIAKTIASQSDKASGKNNKQIVKLALVDLMVVISENNNIPKPDPQKYFSYNSTISSANLAVDKTPPRA